MTSANSFMNSFVNNMKRRIWVWVLCIASLVSAYAGPLSIRLTRNARYLSYGNYYNISEYYRDIAENLLHCVSANYIAYIIIALAIIIAIQGYSYLFSKQKVDLYHSVPVSMKKRFFTIYFNGIFIFTSVLIFSYLISFALVMFRKAVGIPVGKVLFVFLLSFLLFLAAYNLSILAVMLTGNIFMALIMSLTVIFYADIWVNVVDTYRHAFYKTLLTLYDKTNTGISILGIFRYDSTVIGNIFSEFDADFYALVISVIKYLIWIIIPLVWSYLNYRKRPAEAAGSSMAFYASRLIIKLLVSVPVALWFANWMYTVSDSSMPFMIGSMVLGTVVVSLLTEIAFNFELKSAFKHWGTIIISLVFVLSFFSFYKFDILRFDKYIPKADELASYAVINSNESYYTDSINFDADVRDYFNGSYTPNAYAKENMFLTDSEAIIELAKKSQVILEENRIYDENIRCLEVLYRTKSGNTHARYVWVDISDDTNDFYLNRIVGPAYYKQGVWQAMTMDVPTTRVSEVKFIGTLGDVKLKKSEVEHIVSLWKADMDKYDYSRARYDKEYGYITICFDNNYSWNLPVYECFGSLMSYLKATDGYIEQYLPNFAIQTINITYYPSSEYDGYLAPEEYSFSDEETIEMIMAACDTYATHSGWQPWAIGNDYSIEIIIKPEYISKYKKYNFYSYYLVNDRMDALRAAEILP